VSQSRMEKMEWSAVKDYLREAMESRDSANLRLDQVRELLLQSDDLTYEDFLDELKGILE
jgi:hypothetical protein